MIPFNPAATNFDPDNALYLALASELAYSDEVPLKAAILRNLEIDPAQTLLFARGDSAGFVAADANKIILAFRGSEAPATPNGIQDWLRDFDALPVLLSNYANSGPFGAAIHQGFADGASDVLALVVNALWQLDAGRNLPLWITGHSLGGALAVATAIFLRFDSHLKRSIQGLYTYGQPRVASPGLAVALNNDLGAGYQRVVNNLDIVTRVPPRGTPPIYADAGSVEWFNDAGNLNPTVGPLYADLMNETFADLTQGLSAPGNPFTNIFAAFRGSLIQPATDHLLRYQLFANPPAVNPKSYLVKLSNLTGQPLPPAP